MNVGPQPEEISEKRPKAGFLEKIKLHKWKILAGALGILVFTGAVVGAYRLGRRKVQPSAQPIPTPEATVTPTMEPMADWKTYEDQTRGYFIKYPSDWFLDPPGPKNLFGITTITNYDATQIPVHKPLTSDMIKILLGWADKKIRLGQSLRDWVTEKNRVQQISTSSISDVSFGHISGVKVLGREAGPGEGIAVDHVTYYFPKDNQVFMIDIVPADSAHLSIFNLMLSTFRFLYDVESCGSGETYTDARYNFSVWCPSGWFADPAVGGYGATTYLTNYDPRTAPGRIISPGENKLKIGITVLKRDTAQSFEEWAEKTISESLSSSVAKDYGESLELKEDIEINGVTGKKYVISSNLGTAVRIYLPNPRKSNEVYSITTGTEQVFNQILSTFRFLD